MKADPMNSTGAGAACRTASGEHSQTVIRSVRMLKD
jgi:hypothetical protein